MPDETQQPNSEIAPVSPGEPVADTPIPTTNSSPAEVSPQPLESPTEAESTLPPKDDIPANEPLNSVDTTITPNQSSQSSDATGQAEVMQSNSTEATLDKPTAQMAGNEPLDLAEEEKTRKREENLKLANETRQEKKREKIDAILDLFAKQTNLTNDEVEKLLHVSDATATRYLETLEKEGKIKQVGKTGKYTHYEKI